MSDDVFSSVTAGQIRALADRILRLKEEQRALADDIREVYLEAKANGFDKTVLGQLVTFLIKREKQGADAVRENEAIFDLYLTAYDQGELRASHTHTREAVSPKLVETITQAVQTETGRKALGIALDVMIDAETGEITEQPETAIQSQAKASVGNGASVPGGKPADSMSGEASRRDATRTASATSDGGRDGSERRATNSRFRPHCQHPERCGSSEITKHCWSCQAAIDAGRLPA